MLIDTSKQNVFFTSDTHFGHKNIIKYCNRPFTTLQEMDEALIANWNAKVGKDDIVFHLGDFAFSDNLRKYTSRLNGHINLIPGNHDYKVDHSLFNFMSIGSLFEVDFIINGDKRKFVLCHYAMRIWNKSHHGAIHLYGHSHGSLKDDPDSLSIDVGVDAHNYAPVSMDEVLAIMAKKNFKPIDHHGTRE